ncbi:hypothetical protein KY285_028903 [Solanum tuberosum]|nr:hypothetical protein KY285_028903 [Solanum tuberosum]
MSEPFRNWLRMGATIPARIQPGRSTLWQDQSPGQTTLLQEELCYAPPIPIERKSCLVIPRLQHVRSLTPRAAAAVSRTDRRLTCTEPGVFEPAAYD